MTNFNHLFAMWRSSFSPLRLPPLRLFLGGQAISLTGTWLQSTAQSLLVYQLSRGSAGALGSVALITALPALIFSFWVGKAIDRFDRRKLIISIQIGEMLLAFILGWLVHSELVQLWHVYVLAFMLGALEAFVLPAQSAFVANIVGVDKVRDSINLGAMMHNISRTLGPALAGFAIGAYGLAVTFWLNGLSFLAVIASLLMIRVTQRQVGEPRKTKSASLIDGLRFVQHSDKIRDVLISFALLAVFGEAVYAIVPALTHGDATQTGSLLGAAGAGSLFSVLFVMPFINRAKRAGIILSVGVIWMGLWLMLLSQSALFAVSLISLFMAGTATTVVWDASLGLLQVLPPDNMKAQILSIFGIVSMGLMPIASLLLGYLSDRISVPFAVLLSSLTMTLLATLMLSRGSWRNWKIRSSET